MASDGIDNIALCGKIGQLIRKTEILLKKPTINMELNEVLDNYLGELSEKQLYLANGIANVDFPQAGIFIQNAVNLLSKEIDILWDENLQFHMKLCAHSKSTEEKQLEESKILERIDQKRRKKLLTQTKDINSHLNHDISSVIAKADDILKKCSQVQTNNNLQDVWKSAVAANENLSTSNVQLKSVATTPISEYNFTINSTVCDIQTKEKICNYNDLYNNLATFSNCDEKFSNNDDLLQKYLRKKHLTYAEFSKKKLASDFECWKESIQQQQEFNKLNVNEDLQRLCSKTSVVHLSRIPDALMNKFLRRSLSVVDECNNSLSQDTNKPTRLKATSECVSDADSLFHDGPFEGSDDEQPQNISSKRCSVADSGIYSNSEDILLEEDHGQSGYLGLSPIQETCEESSTSLQTSETQVISNEDNIPVSSDETVEVTPANDKQQAKKTVTDDTPAFFQDRKTKRGLRDEEEEDEPKIKRRKIRFRWLKTITTNLKTYEKFYKKHYQPEVGEDDFFTYEESDEETTVCSEDEDSGTCQMDAFDCLSVDVTNIENGNVTELPSPPTEVSTHFPVSCSTPVPEEPETFSSNPVLAQISNCEQESSSRIKAVSDWKKFIEPKLIEAEKTLDFDIHKYGSNIMNSMNLSEKTSFKNIVQGKEATEVTRHFLATLQLANTANIELITQNPGKLANDTMELKLLTRERYHEHLNEFEAPSENSFKEKLAKIQALRPHFVKHSTIKNNFHRKRKRF